METFNKRPKSSKSSFLLFYGVATLTLLTIAGYTFGYKPWYERRQMKNAEELANIIYQKENVKKNEL